MIIRLRSCKFSLGTFLLILITFLRFFSGTAQEIHVENKDQLLTWEKLPPLPVSQGLVGMFAGVSNGALIIAGGVSSFQQDEQRFWNDKIYVLKEKTGSWIVADQVLPSPLAHGVSVTYVNSKTGIDGVICAGGDNGQGSSDQVFLLNWDGQKIILNQGPSLPYPCTFGTGAVLKGKLYIAGGLVHQNETTNPLKNFWELDLAKAPDNWTWRVLDPLPAPARYRALSTSQYGGFYLFGGLNGSEALRDAYRFVPGLDERPGNWTMLTPKQISSGFGLSPVLPLGQSHIAILGESLISQSKPTQRANTGSIPIYTYHTVTNAWAIQGTVPDHIPLIDAASTSWQSGYVVAGGETPEGIASSQVSYGQLIPQEAPFGWQDWSVLILYLVILIYVGYYFSKREKDTDDYFLGGRRVPWWAAGLSIIGTGLSAISYMGTPAVVFETDMVRIIGSLMYLPAGILAIYFFLPFYRRLNVTTAYHYLELRFNVAVRMFISGIFIASQFGRMAVVVYLPALALSSVTGIDVNLCIGLMGFLAILYTVLGGIEAVIWTDVIQVIILYAGAILCLGIVLWEVGGVSEVISIGSTGNKFRVANFTWDYTVMAFYIMFFGTLIGVFVGYGSDQSYVQRYLTTPTEKDAAKSILTSGVLPFITAPLFTFFGAGLWVFYKIHPEMLHPGNNDALVPTFVAQMLPPGISGLVIAGIFAASMSSLDSGMHSAATAYITDFHRRIKKDISETSALRMARLITIIFGLIGTLFSFLLVQVKELPIFDAWALLINLIVGGYGGAFLLGIFTRKANGWGTFIGIFFGALVPYLVMTYTNINFYAWGVIAVVSCLISGYLASLLLPSQKKDLTGLTIYTLNDGKKSSDGVDSK